MHTSTAKIFSSFSLVFLYFLHLLERVLGVLNILLENQRGEEKNQYLTPSYWNNESPFPLPPYRPSERNPLLVTPTHVVHGFFPPPHAIPSNLTIYNPKIPLLLLEKLRHQ
ncbi:unnamed protein product [Lepeophtheirus salmonis]|uniref:(salmon louse) hypothetical protein n=1 Tax=Lepeophtheirus salmonis TaxID=72036 RepID=A0A7R8CU57_LEPSM|nr:unnamed protein product [Lepeophtheirus salmonis]CAF2930996.1 unnamed protein product [Lepeophtheirus salmonis]